MMFSSYDKRVVSDEQIQAWADEAERATTSTR